MNNLISLYLSNQNVLWVGFISNFFSTIFAAFILFLLLEKRISNKQKRQQEETLFSNLVVEVITNYVIAQKIIEKSDFILRTDKFPPYRFKFLYINSFLSEKPLEKQQFLYTKLAILVTNMEMSNSLIDLVFSSNDKGASLENKKTAIQSAHNLLNDISEILKILNSFSDKFNYKDSIVVPGIEEMSK